MLAKRLNGYMGVTRAADALGPGINRQPGSADALGPGIGRQPDSRARLTGLAVSRTRLTPWGAGIDAQRKNPSSANAVWGINSIFFL